MLTRVPSWPEILSRSVAEARDLPFAWGTHDCMLWATAVVYRMTGTDLARGFRGKYASAFGAARLLAPAGGTVRGMARAIARQYGVPEIGSADAQRGDIVCLPDGPLGEALGVCLGQWSVGPGETGLRRVPTAQALCAWRI